MKELKCPHCGKAITLSEDQYESIAIQVRSSEFHAEVDKQVELKHKTWEVEKQKEYDEKTKKLIDDYDSKLKVAQEQIEQIKSFKTQLSTKMLGESLEQHCSIVYEQDLRPLLTTATFEKDTIAIKEEGDVKGTKGDFIFRDFNDGVEYISIMFEMKNEADTTLKKKKNFDHLKKLDEDRTKKNCDYAVLVSTLESDNELFNTGIVDVSYMYPKMYVVRPAFFKAIIQILMNAEKRNIPIRQKLAEIELKNRDYTTFESNIKSFKDLFEKHCKEAGNNFQKALDNIDNSINQLKAIRTLLTTSVKQLGQADANLADMLNLKKITKGCPAIREKLEEARKNNANPDEQ